MQNKKIEDRKKFLRYYKAALKTGVSKEQLSKILNIKPKSLIRRRLVIKDATGYNLEFLKIDDTDISDDKLLKFNTELQKLFEEEPKENIITDNDIFQYDRLVITSAQNSTPIHDGFLASIFTYQTYNKNTGFKVIPYRYKNPTSIFQDKKFDYWDEKLFPFLLTKRTKIFDNLQILADGKIQATSPDPLSGLYTLSGTDSAVIGHPRVHWTTIPTPTKSLPKIMVTTGSITLSNYTSSAAGLKAAEFHKFAAVILEFDRVNNVFHLRHIHADAITGEFYDVAGGILRKYTPTGVYEGERLIALVTGDVHAIYHDSKVEKATYTDTNSICNRLMPLNHVIHDINDCYTISHWHKNNPTILLGKHRFGRNNLEKELQMGADLLDRITREDMTTYIVKSNHDEHLDKWLNDKNNMDDMENRQLFLHLNYYKTKHVYETTTGFKTIDPYEFWCHHPDNERGLKNIHLVKFLKRDDDEGFSYNGIDFSFHGDVGSGGAKGSIKAFTKCGIKFVIGHSHVPGIILDVYQVGVSAYLDLEYKSGLDAWLQTHCLVYPDGNRVLITVIKGKWYLDQEKLQMAA